MDALVGTEQLQVSRSRSFLWTELGSWPSVVFPRFSGGRGQDPMFWVTQTHDHCLLSAYCLCQVAVASGLVFPASRDALEGRGLMFRLRASNSVSRWSLAMGLSLLTCVPAGLGGLSHGCLSNTCLLWFPFPLLPPGYRLSCQLCLSALPWCSAWSCHPLASTPAWNFSPGCTTNSTHSSGTCLPSAPQERVKLEQTTVSALRRAGGDGLRNHTVE